MQLKLCKRYFIEILPNFYLQLESFSPQPKKKTKTTMMIAIQIHVLLLPKNMIVTSHFYII